ncbi:hypothetical protein KEC48_03295 [Clostridium sp. C1]|uniref:hypothetical protein n=1 Tax=Clostridium sp. C1 TaxID=1155388 RepID=UPI001BA88791|nr:hypothetical protein [Clostridium sp. C1]QUN13564.1 hypothetical protein KEC48_03295 [Clostridium sp. C1]
MALKKIIASLTQPGLNIIEDNEDEMKIIVECPYCHEHVQYGETIMISGFVGCSHCYWGENGLMETVMKMKEENYDEYVKGDFYKRGYRG